MIVDKVSKFTISILFRTVINNLKKPGFLFIVGYRCIKCRKVERFVAIDF